VVLHMGNEILEGELVLSFLQRNDLEANTTFKGTAGLGLDWGHLLAGVNPEEKSPWHLKGGTQKGSFFDPRPFRGEQKKVRLRPWSKCGGRD